MTDDLIERLRGYGDGNNDLMDAAADRIEKLESENNDIGVHLDGAMARIEKLKAALREIACNGNDDCASAICRNALEGKDG